MADIPLTFMRSYTPGFELEPLESRVLLSATPVPAPEAPEAVASDAPSAIEFQHTELDSSSLGGGHDLFEGLDGVELPAPAALGLPGTDPVETVAAADATAVLLPSGRVELEAKGGRGGVVGLWKFTTGAGAGPTDIRFTLGAGINPFNDTALALYDADGNLLQREDRSAGLLRDPEVLLAEGLLANRLYMIAVISDTDVAPRGLKLTVEVLSQLPEAAPLVVDPTTGRGSLSANALSTWFRSPSDQRVHALDLLNLGASATLTLTTLETGLDLQATVYRRLPVLQLIGSETTATPTFEVVASGVTNGTSVELALAAEPGQTLSEGDYFLVVAPKGFESRAAGYTVAVALGSSILVPGRLVSADWSGAPMLKLAPTETHGIARADFAEQLLQPGTARFFQVRSPVDGVVRFEVDAGFSAVLAIYDGSTQTLLEVRTIDRNGLLVASVEVSSRNATVIRVSADTAGGRGVFRVGMQTPYNSSDLNLARPADGATNTTIGTVFVGATVAPRFYRVVPAAGIDFMTFRVNGAAFNQVRITVVGPGFTQEATAPLGAAALLTLDFFGKAGPFFMSVSSEVGGGFGGLLEVGQLVLPRELPLTTFPGRRMDVNTGDVTLAPTAFDQFGARVGLSYYQMLSEPGQSSTWTATGSATGQPLLVRYAESGSVLRLQDYVLADATGKAVLQRSLDTERLYAAVAFKLGLPRGGTVGLELNNPTPLAVGVGMVPDLEYENPGLGRYGSILKIEQITLASDYDQDLWATLLPENFHPGSVVTDPAWPVLRLVPGDPGSNIQLRLTLYDAEGGAVKRLDGTALLPMTSQPGSELVVDFKQLGVPRQALIGQKLQFRVEAVTGKLGDGVYSLRMTVRTSNPHPYEVTERAWRFSGVDPPGFPNGDTGIFPNGTRIVDIIQNQRGDGTATNIFTSSDPTVHVYRFWTPLSGALRVWTTGISNDPANTTIQLYRARFVVEQSSENAWWNDVDYIEQVAGVSPSTDWFQADRSEIDSQIWITDERISRYAEPYDDFGNTPGDHLSDANLNPPYKPTDRELTNNGFYFFVVVKNEQASQGRYRIHVDAEDLPLIQRAPVQLPLRPNAASLGSVDFVDVPNLGNYLNFVGYLPIQMPETHTGTLKVTGEDSGRWRFDLFDASGQELSAPAQLALLPSTRSFSIPDGPRLVYLRLGEDSIPNSGGRVELRTTLSEDSPLPSSLSTLGLDGVAHRLLPTDPFGELESGAFTDSVAVNASGKVYRVAAGPGKLTVNVNPIPGSLVSLLWGVYVNGRLVAWDKAIPGNLASQVTELGLPAAKLPGAPDGTFESRPLHDVKIVVKHASVSNQPGQYSVAIDTDGGPIGGVAVVGATAAPLPRSAEEAGTQFGALELGDRWTRFSLPDGLTGSVVISGLPSNPDLYPLRYDLYNASGRELLASGTKTEPGSVPSLSLPGVVGGTGYLLRVTGRDQSLSFIGELVYTLPKAAGSQNNTPVFSVPSPRLPLQTSHDRRANPDVEGEFTTVLDLAGKTQAWILHNTGNPGPATFTATFTGSQAVHIAVYTTKGATGELPEMTLVDYANESSDVAVEGGKQVSFKTFLPAGTYYIQVKRSNTAAGLVRVDVTGPEYPVHDLILDPNQGQTLRPNFGTGSSGLYASTFFRVITPEGSKGEAIFNAVDLNLADGKQDEPLLRKGFITLWTGGGSTLGGVGMGPALAPITRQLTLGGDLIERATITTPGVATPFTTYLIAVHIEGSVFAPFRNSPGFLGIQAIFDIPNSGTPDLVVETVTLSPNNGQTLVEISVYNRGYATAFSSASQFSYPSVVASSPIIAELAEGTLGPQTRRVRLLDWVNPVAPTDVTRYIADSLAEIQEIDETNNSGSVAMQSVNAHRPTLTVTLTAGLDGNSDSAVWGRYIDSRINASVEVTGKITVQAQDGDDAANTYDAQDDVYLVRTDSPMLYTVGSHIRDSLVELNSVPLSRLPPTSPGSPNVFSAYVVDRFGLRSDTITRVVEVVPYPTWLDDGPQQIEFNDETQEYDLAFHATPINYSKTLNQMLGVTVPFVGGWRNEFIIDVRSDAAFSLNPDQPIPTLRPAVAVKITALDRPILNTVFTTQNSANGHASVSSILQVDSRTLQAQALQLTFGLNDYPIDQFEGPEIPIFGFDAAVVSAAVQAQVIVSASMNAAVTLAFDLSDSNAPLRLASPTFIGLDFSVELRFEGELEVLGWDIASVGGGFIFSLQPLFGLERTNEPLPIPTALQRMGFGLTATIGGELSASVLGVEVFSVEMESDPIQLTGFEVATQAAGSPPPREIAPAAVASPPAIDIRVRVAQPKGTDLLGTLQPTPSPQLIASPTGTARMITFLDYPVVNGVAGTPVIYYAIGDDSGFSAPVALGSSEWVTRPLLARTNDGPGLRAVLVYQSTPVPTAATTRNDYFGGQDLKYRYYDGTNWGEEQSLTNDARFDSQASISFNAAGQGLVTWLANAQAAPIDDRGALRNTAIVYAARWDATRRAFSAASLVNNTSSNWSPTAYAAPDGSYYVAYLRTADNAIILSRSTTGAWASIRGVFTGVPAAAEFRSVALGGEGTNGLFVAVVAREPSQAGTSTRSYLLARKAAFSQFANAGTMEFIAQTGGVSDLRSSLAPDGTTVLSWVEHRGSLNDVMITRRGVAGVGTTPWSAPARLTQSVGDERAPSLAITADGSYALVFERGARFFPNPGQPPVPGDGLELGPGFGTLSLIGSTAVRARPEISFSTPLTAIGLPTISTPGLTPGLAVGSQPGKSAGVAGSTVTLSTVLTNSGHAVADVVVEFVSGSTGNETRLGEQRLKLSPGASFTVRQQVKLIDGVRLITARARLAPGTAEAFNSSPAVVALEISGRPDLAVEALSVSPVAIQVGADIPLKFRVTNRSGLGFDGSVTVTTFWVDPGNPGIRNVVRSETLALQIDALSSQNLGSSVKFGEAGLRLAGVQVRSAALDELTLGNNVEFVPIDIRPDLALDPVTIKLRDSTLVTPPLQVKIDGMSGVDNAVVSVLVSNSGKAPVVGFRLKVLHSLDDGADREVFNALQTVLLQPGEFKEVQMKLSALAGANRYRAVVELLPADQSTGLGEYSTSNNVASVTAMLQGLPDLTVASARILSVGGTPPNLRIGTSPRMEIDVRNLGIATARNVIVEVFARSASTGRGLGTLLAQGTIANIAPLSTERITLTLSTALLGLEDDNLAVVIDRSEQVLELSDRNNSSLLKIAVTPATFQQSGYQINNGGTQLSTVRSFTATFNRDVRATLGAGAFVLTNTTTGEIIPSTSISAVVDSRARKITWTFPGLNGGTLPEGDYEVRLGAGALADTSGNLLARDVILRFTVVSGDANGDGLTNERDYLMVWRQIRKPLAERETSFDLTGDGVVDQADLEFVKTNYGRSAVRGAAPTVVSSGP